MKLINCQVPTELIDYPMKGDCVLRMAPSANEEPFGKNFPFSLVTSGPNIVKFI